MATAQQFVSLVGQDNLQTQTNYTHKLTLLWLTTSHITCSHAAHNIIIISDGLQKVYIHSRIIEDFCLHTTTDQVGVDCNLTGIALLYNKEEF